MKRLLSELTRLVEASKTGDCCAVIDVGALSGDEAAAAGLLNEAMRNFKTSVEHGKTQMQEMLRHRGKMLDALNDMAVKLMSLKDQTFSDVMNAALKSFTAVGGIDRVAVYRRFGEITDMGQIYLWYGETLPLEEELVKLPVIPPILRWLELLTKGHCINANKKEMPEDEAEFVSLFGVKGIFFVPIFVREVFWGVVTIEDHTNYRRFEEENLDLLRSAAYLCSGAVARDEMEREINDANVKLRSAYEQATAASRAKSNFLSNMSHEMRTPLNAIIGMTAIGKNAETIEQKNRALNKIGDASSHLLAVINDVLDMAKIEADKLELAPVEYDFKKMLQKVLDVVNFRVDEKQQRLTVNVDGNIPKLVTGDDSRLAQVITNLLSNAVKFTPEGGGIRLDASLAGETDGECELLIEITDQGIGISQEQQSRLFRAFEQAESGTSREYGGTGLGLVISKRIVELMGGSIEVKSELGKGAKFIFTVKVRRGNPKADERANGGAGKRVNNCACGNSPANSADAGVQTGGLSGNKTAGSAAGGAAAPANNDGRNGAASSKEVPRPKCRGEFCGKRMLLAEDIEINREILIVLLEDTGITIDCAENGRIALDMVAGDPNKYDIIFMDMQMPQMDGLEAARRIRALPERCRGRVPIIAMTANVFKCDIEACMEAGMDDHLGKPLDMEKVLEALRKYLR